MPLKFKHEQTNNTQSDWGIAKLGNFIEVETGKRTKGGALSKGKVASIGGEHIDVQGNIKWSDMKFIPKDFYKLLKQGKVRLGDILLVKDGATTGKVALTKDLKYEKVAVNEHVFIIRNKTNRLENEFLFYFLFSDIGQAEIKKRVHGMIGGIIRKDLSAIPISLPPIKEQRKIVSILTRIDKVIQRIDEVIMKTEKLKGDILQKLFTEGLSHEEFENTKIGKIPKDWKVVRLRKVATHVNSGLTPRGGASTYLDQGIPFIRSQNVLMNKLDLSDVAYISPETHNSMARSSVSPGDLLLNITGASIGRVAVLSSSVKEANVNQHVCRIRFREEITPAFASYYLSTPSGQRQIMSFQAGATRQGLNYRQIKSLLLPCPPLSEQQRITEIISAFDDKLELDCKRRKKFKRIKKGLMNDLFSGKKRIEVAM